MFCNLLEVSWGHKVDWEYWKSSAQSLAPNHPTMARESSNQEDKQLEKVQGSETFNSIRREHSKILNAMVSKIRVKGYSIRTEQSYESWICRFIAYHQNRSPQEILKKS